VGPPCAFVFILRPFFFIIFALFVQFSWLKNTSDYITVPFGPSSGWLALAFQLVTFPFPFFLLASEESRLLPPDYELLPQNFPLKFGSLFVRNC